MRNRDVIFGGLALLVGTQGCTSMQPVYDEQRRVVAYKEEFDAKKTAGAALQGIGAAISIAGAAAGVNTSALVGGAFRIIGNDITNEKSNFPKTNLPMQPKEKYFTSQPILVSSSIGIAPLHLGYSALQKREYGKATYEWSLDGNIVGRGSCGQVTIQEKGEHNLELLVKTEDGKSYLFDKKIRILPRINN